MPSSQLATLVLKSSVAFDLVSMQGSESLSSLYNYSLVVMCDSKASVNFDDYLGKPVEVGVTDGVQDRRFHGMVAGMRFESGGKRHNTYRMEMVPLLWLLTRSANVRIFQKKTTIDIIKLVVAGYGAVLVDSTKATLHKREYCVQYRESDFNFVSRLMEEEGIYYFFRHSAGKHEMVLVDAANTHAFALGLNTLPYNPVTGVIQHDEVVSRWIWSQYIQTGKVTVRDHHFMMPSSNFEKTEAAAGGHPHGDIEAYDHAIGLPPFADDPESPSTLEFLVPQAGSFAKHRLEALQAMRATVEGSTNSIRLCAGARFKLAEHPVGKQDAEYVVQSTSIRLRNAGFETGGDKRAMHECDFIAYPSAVPYRAARLTPKPRVSGLQTATVVGPAGEEIFVDKYGRVKVQFHWDRTGEKNASSSCYVRVAQATAGKGFGAVMLPRIGQEVVVDFLEGDPDQPLIVGGVYNAQNMPPYVLPDNKTISTVKTNSSPGGGGFNELKFDDKKGSELVFLQAQKDLTENVLNDVKTDIGHDLTLTIKNDRTETVTAGKFDVTVKAGKHNLTVKDDIKVTAQAKYNLDATSDVTIESKTKITFKVGQSVIEMTPSGVSIKSVKIEAKADAQMALESAMVEAKASGVMTIKGSLVKVN